MKKIYGVALLALLALPAKAEPVAFMTIDMPQELIVWVEARTGTDLSKQQKIYVVENDDPLFADGDAQHMRKAAAYYKEKIWFPTRTAVHLSEIGIQAVAVHELIHAAQEISGRHYTCLDQMEAEAYSYQNLYLAERQQIQVLTTNELAALRECRN